jgi:hypothetical protein
MWNVQPRWIISNEVTTKDLYGEVYSSSSNKGPFYFVALNFAGLPDHHIYRVYKKKCTPFQIQIRHNLLNIWRCSACSKLAHFISYADLNNAYFKHFSLSCVLVHTNRSYSKFPCAEDLVFSRSREIIRLSNYYNRLRLISWIWKGVHFLIHPVCMVKVKRRSWMDMLQ